MYHEPVLLEEVLEALDPKSNDDFVDCTLGDAGHTIEILKKTAPNGKVFAFELDGKAIGAAKARLEKEGLLKRVKIINDNFRNLKNHINKGVDGILADLGLRSGQLEDGGGGFSFKSDELLDMRFGNFGRSAAEIVNEYTKSELEAIFRKYGEERNSRGIAEKIVEVRRKNSIKTTSELSEIILEFYRDKFKTKKEIPWVGGIHPATRVFQALRIEANDELGSLEQLLEDGIDVLSSEGRMAIISYHSLEDRIVKRFYRTSPHLVIVTKKPIKPSEEEVRKNKRARSAKLRAAIKK
ncbi:MAG: 16S rRNA (cytosine(1402)-N(4))-methyltransferase RsmH [Patescibacteria group bacterium]